MAASSAAATLASSKAISGDVCTFSSLSLRMWRWFLDEIAGHFAVCREMRRMRRVALLGPEAYPSMEAWVEDHPDDPRAKAYWATEVLQMRRKIGRRPHDA